MTAAAESYSEHSLERAVMAHTRTECLPIVPSDQFDYRRGRGVTATVEGRVVAAGNRTLVPDAPEAIQVQDTATAVHVSVDGRYAGTVVLADVVRDTARAAVAELHRRGLHLALWSPRGGARVGSGHRLPAHGRG